MTPRLTAAEGLALSRILIEVAKARGMDWEIVYTDGPIGGDPGQREPHAFRLVNGDSCPKIPDAVIGETMDDALDCITLTAVMHKQLKKT